MRIQDRWSFLRAVCAALASATWHGLACYFIPLYTLGGTNGSGRHHDVAGIGTAVYCSLIVTVNLRLAIRTRRWTIPTHVVIWSSIGGWFAAAPIMSWAWAQYRAPGEPAFEILHVP